MDCCALVGIVVLLQVEKSCTQECVLNLRAFNAFNAFVLDSLHKTTSKSTLNRVELTFYLTYQPATMDCFFLQKLLY